jgi:sulfite exporter TauE/SafE
MMESMYLSALVVGLLGGVHCLGMCGGVVGTLTFQLEPKAQVSFWRMLPYQLGYNLGRISSYALMGAVFGYLGHTLISLTDLLPLQQTLQWLAGGFMILLGLYLGGWWQVLVHVEKLGQRLWKRIQPLGQKMLPVRHFYQAWGFGFVWGWLPCGLVYSMLIMALSAGGALQGAGVMLAFGLGTLPNLLLMGSFAFVFTRLSRNRWVQKGAGLGVIAMGAWQWYLALTVSVH